MPELAEQDAHRKRDGARLVYVLWAGGLGLLIAAGAVVWGAVIPYCQVRRATELCLGADPPWDINPARAQVAVQKLGGPGKALGPLSRYMRLPRRLTPYRECGPVMLGECGPQAVPELLRLLHDESDYVRAHAAITLGRMQDERGYEPLLSVLSSDPDPFVRGMAAVGLGHYGRKEAFEPILTVQQTDAALEARRMASQALGLLKDQRAIDTLIAQLSDAEASMRGAAAWALGQIGDRRPEARLTQIAADDTEEQVRNAAAEALKKIRAEEPGK
jgi:hypothetical protein